MRTQLHFTATRWRPTQAGRQAAALTCSLLVEEMLDSASSSRSSGRSSPRPFQVRFSVVKRWCISISSQAFFQPELRFTCSCCAFTVMGWMLSAGIQALGAKGEGQMPTDVFIKDLMALLKSTQTIRFFCTNRKAEVSEVFLCHPICTLMVTVSRSNIQAVSTGPRFWHRKAFRMMRLSLNLQLFSPSLCPSFLRYPCFPTGSPLIKAGWVVVWVF